MFEKKEFLLDRIKKAKIANEVGQVIYFNNGSVQTETNGFAKKMEDFSDRVQIELLMDNFCDATASYARQYEMDTMEVGLLLGLIYNARDVDENNKPLEGAKPVNNIVRYYDAGFKSYKDGQQTNDPERDFGKYNVTYQGYVHYDKLVKAFEGSGIEFTGPQSFKEFKEAIEAGEVFETSLVADLKKYTKENGTGLSK